MNLTDGQTILFTGDSITDCDRARPVGEGPWLGNGYVAQVNALLEACYPQRRIRVLNTGIGGNRVTDLEARWQADVLSHQPDWLSIMIGINDVWRQFDGANDPDQVDIARYEATYRRLLTQTRPQLSGGLILMTPFFIEANRADPMRAMMDEYSAVVAQLASEFDAIFVDTQAAYDHYLTYRPTQSLCGDRIHPNQSGHMLMARAFLAAVQFKWHATQ